jgi:GNAT superfamily N-acetyltransferase
MSEHSSVHIREYTPADRGQVLALAPRLTEGMAPDPWVKPGAMPSACRGHETLRDRAAWLEAVHGWLRDAADSADRPDQVVYVAVDGDKLVGVIHAAERTHFTGQVDAYVGELVTAAGQERRGIGRALMKAAEDWGAARGLRYLTLETGMANHGARAFYASLGYLEEDVRLTKKIAPD